MANILFPDDVAFLEGPSLEFAGPYLRNIMGRTVPGSIDWNRLHA